MKAQTPQHAKTAFAGRDRALLYTRGMDVDPLESVDLVRQSLAEAGPEASPGEVMEKLFALLRKTRREPVVLNDDDRPVVCSPPMNRSVVLAKDMEQLSLCGMIADIFRKKAATPKATPGSTDD